MFRGVARRLRRRSPDRESSSADEGQGQAVPQDPAPDAERGRSRRRASASRSRPRVVVRFRMLVLLVLFVVAVLLLAGGMTTISAEVVSRWPWLLVILGMLWLLVGLVTAWPHGTLGGPVVIAIGFVALLDQQLIASSAMTAAGAVMVALGLAVIVRGLTMPRV